MMVIVGLMKSVTLILSFVNGMVETVVLQMAALLARSHVTQPMAPLPVIQNPMIVVARLAQSATLPIQLSVKTGLAT
jgi:lysylphosphatidylglycerol synthetase-like protein (DUF2156 family)